MGQTVHARMGAIWMYTMYSAAHRAREACLGGIACDAGVFPFIRVYAAGRLCGRGATS